MEYDIGTCGRSSGAPYLSSKVNVLNLRSCDQFLCCYWLFGNWFLSLIPRWLCTNWNTDWISLDIISCCGDLEDFIRNHFNYTSCQKHGTLHSITRVWKIIFCSHFSVQYAWETFNCWEIVRCNSLYNSINFKEDFCSFFELVCF